MSSKVKALVLDTWAIIAYFGDEPASGRVAELLAEANENGTPLWMSVVNAGEVWYIIARRTSASEADGAIAELHNLGIRLEDVDWKITRQAAVFKSNHKISYADAFAAALAALKKAHMVTGDQEFKSLEGDVKIVWLEGER